MSNTTTTRHSVRCQTEGCGRFSEARYPHCKVCNASYQRGREADTGAVAELRYALGAAREKQAMMREERDAAREAAVADHAAHQAEMEAQERKADAVIAEQRTVIAETRAEVEIQDRLLAQSREIIADRDREIATLTDRVRNYDQAMGLLAERTQERDAAQRERDNAREGARGAISQRDALAARLATVNRRDWFLFVWAIVATIGAVVVR